MAQDLTPAVPQARKSEGVDSEPRRLGYSSLAVDKTVTPPADAQARRQTSGLGEHRPPRADEL
jgi:hypothetical protein